MTNPLDEQNWTGPEAPKTSPEPGTSAAPVTGPISISSEDLQSEEVILRVDEMHRARQVALVREVGLASEAKGSGSLRAILILSLGGLVGGVIAFGILRLVFDKLDLFADNSFATNLSFTFVLAFAIGICVALADVATTRNWAKVGRAAGIVLPVTLGAALIGGLIAHFFYSAATDWLFNSAYEAATKQDMTNDEFVSYIQLRLHPIRGIAWMFVGVAAGVAAGSVSKSWKRIGVSAAGGAIGGFLGGFVFDFLPGEWIAQLVGITILGLLIGLAMAIMEQATKTSWIEIVTGGLAGKQFILYRPAITIGSAPTSDITLIKDSAIPGVAATISTRGGQPQIVASSPLFPVVVNGSIDTASRLSDGDIITFGSTQLRFRMKSSKSRVPGALQT